MSENKHLLAACLFFLWLEATTASCFGANPAPEAELLTKEGTVESSLSGTGWDPAAVGENLFVGDRLRTLERSSATIRHAVMGRLSIDQLTTIEILPPQDVGGRQEVDLKEGALYIFTRERPREFILQTPDAIGASRGTEFLAEVVPNRRSIITVFDGEVDVANSYGSITITNNERAVIEKGRPPVKTPVIEASQIVQWWLYYPGVLDPDELDLSASDQQAISSSLAAYKEGNLAAALERYPASRHPQSGAEKIYYAALLLSVGEVAEARLNLAGVSRNSPLAEALRQVIDLTCGRRVQTAIRPTTATEWLALSYVKQPGNLTKSLAAAKEAVKMDPAFGFALERVAELEFCFGHAQAAAKAVSDALRVSPGNAQAVALQGFILSSQNKIQAAELTFDRAIKLDGHLGNAWLGRGLCRIRLGRTSEGLADLETAAALEPDRSLLRSYLGKAFAMVHDYRHADRELALAEQSDTNDPTPLLYSALLKEQENRLNPAIQDLEKSQSDNDNRRVYRSGLLLDQDRAVRGFNLAEIYNRDGMEQLSFREAGQAVDADYGNYSAHQFLANSLNQLRDPTRFNLRYETAWLNELLLADLLSPIGAGSLSQNVNQQEYSKLFEQNGLGVVSDSYYRSDGQFQQTLSQFGIQNNSEYAIDLGFQHNSGIRPNNELTTSSEAVELKQQLTPEDSVYAQVFFSGYHSGDNFQYYSASSPVQTNYDFTEHQTPTVILGGHHEWAPGVHTLILGTRFSDQQNFASQDVPFYYLWPPHSLTPYPNSYFFFSPSSPLFNYTYHDSYEIYSAELNQIFDTGPQVLILGARFQGGNISAGDSITPTGSSVSGYPGGEGAYLSSHYAAGSLSQDTSSPFSRLALYGYETLKLPSNLDLTGGIAWDQVTYPDDFFDLPINSGTARRADLGPKAALSWSPISQATLRAVYSESIGGVGPDQSYRLEPVQLAGFTQTYRDIVPLVLGSAGSAPRFQVCGAAVDLNFSTGTYFSAQFQLLKSDVDEQIGLFEGTADILPYYRTNTSQLLNYKEPSVLVTFNQLIGKDWQLGLTYQFSQANATIQYPNLGSSAVITDTYGQDVHAQLNQVTPYLVFNHRSGFFARAEANLYSQINMGYSPALPGDTFYQINLFAGWRFPDQHGDLTLGLLNLNGSDYHLNPLSLYSELPRKMLLSLEFRLSF